MAMSSKKITYTSDFKLKVLDYYFKNGGDENFGLKKKTAQHFNIDKKTINRMLNNPDMVKRARKLLARKVTPPPKTAPSTRQAGAKTSAAKGTKVAASKVNVASSSGKVTASSHTSASSNSGGSSYKASTSSASSTKHVGGSSSSGQGSNTQSSAKATASKTRNVDQENDNGVQVFDLPEDPDYSILKKSINASTNGVANLAKLLVTGTKEVKNLILNECDVILECKVCNNLFRSVVNFLAHKRIYCREEYADVRSLFHKDNVQGITSHSRTVVVEPEPPPDTTPQHIQPDPTTSASNTLTVPVRPGVQRSERRSGIDSIARRLANKRKGSSPSSSTHTGSSAFYQRISDINDTRDKLSRDCSVVLEDIGGVANAMFQTYVPPTKSSPVPIRKIIDEVSEHEKGVTVAINENGEIMKTAAGNVTTMDVDETPANTDSSKEILCRICNTRFATQKTLSVHQRTQHEYERNVYFCPICKSTFLSEEPVVKHLQRVHKKTKSQTDRLRKVIKKNMYKKMVYQRDELKEQDEIDKSSEKELEKDDDDNEEEEEEEEQDREQNDEEEEREEMEVEEESLSDQTTKMDSDSSPHKRNSANTTPKNSPMKSPMKGDENDTGCPSDHRCVKCDRRFMTASALLSHDKFCSLLQMRPDIPPESPLNPRLRSETPEKKIAIQIRKDYKKTMAQPGSGTSSWSEEDKSQPFKVPHVPKELQFVKDPQSPKEAHNSKELLSLRELRSHQQENQTLPESQEPKEYETEKGGLENSGESGSHSKIGTLLNQFCNMSRLLCIPCEKRYQSITTLKRHASQHFDWTRFSCKVCKYRSYHRYEAIRHCVNEHQASEEQIAKMIKDDECIGPLKYYINPSNTSLSRSQSPSEPDTLDSSERDEEDLQEKERDVGDNEIIEDITVKEEKKENDTPKISEEKMNDVDIKTENLSLSVSTDPVIQEENEKDTKGSSDCSVDTSLQTKVSLEVTQSPSECSLPKSSKAVKREESDNLVKKEESKNGTGIEESSKASTRNVCNAESKERLDAEKDDEADSTAVVKAQPVVLKQYPIRGQKDALQSVSLLSSDSEEGKCERPQRTRRAVEQKDFIYCVKRSSSAKSENDVGKKNKVPEGKSRKRSLSARFEQNSKKRKISESSTPEPCNGSATQSAVLNSEGSDRHSVPVSNGKSDLDAKLTSHGSPVSKKNQNTIAKAKNDDGLHCARNSSESPSRESDADIVDTTNPGISKKLTNDFHEESNSVEGHGEVRDSSSLPLESAPEAEIENKSEDEVKRWKAQTASGTEKGQSTDDSKEVIPQEISSSVSQLCKSDVEHEGSPRKCVEDNESLESKKSLSVTPLLVSEKNDTPVESKDADSCVLENGNCDSQDVGTEKIGASVLSDTSDSKLDSSSCQMSQKNTERIVDDKHGDDVKKQKQKEDLLETMRAVYNKPRDDGNQ